MLLIWCESVVGTEYLERERVIKSKSELVNCLLLETNCERASNDVYALISNNIAEHPSENLTKWPFKAAAFVAGSRYRERKVEQQSLTQPDRQTQDRFKCNTVAALWPTSVRGGVKLHFN